MKRDRIEAPVLKSRSMRDIDRVLHVVAPRDVAVTFTGESGTGKEVLARRLHELSNRRAGPFIPINCAAIPEALFESELFGHERGAFTGATERTKGKIEVANGGILFLDEVGEMPIGVQSKLLRFLENHRFMRVGGTTKISVDLRIVTATLRPLEEEVREGRFREDLFYRLQGVAIVVPPLRDRPDDLRPLIAQLTQQLSAKHGLPPPRYTRSALAALTAYRWPGNIRELRTLVEVLAVLRSGKQARLVDLPAGMRMLSPATETHHAHATIEIALDAPLKDSVARIIHAAIEAEDGNQSKAAARLKISLRTVQRYRTRARATED